MIENGRIQELEEEERCQRGVVWGMVEERARARARARRGICRGHSQRRTRNLEIQDVLTCIKQRNRMFMFCPKKAPSSITGSKHYTSSITGSKH